ncbi:MAG: BLUF domain-containing protein [Hylemonella sp.]|nr:BLUF domain-containing protein [Hylemonella sp.]
MLSSLAYVSTAVHKLSNESLSNLIEKAASRNDSLGVTGLLLYSDGLFMQCLEGSKESLDMLMRSIRSDPRHFDLIVLWQDEISNREFPDWGMAARSPDAGLRTMSNGQKIDEWLKHSVDKKKSAVRLLLEDFWHRFDKHNVNPRLQ